LEQSTKSLGLRTAMEAKPINDEPGVTAWIAKLKREKPHGILVMLQHIHCWPWATRIAAETQIPVVIFAPVGTAFTGHVAKAYRTPGIHVVSSLEWSAVEDGLRMFRAKRMFEETRVLWLRGDKRNETVMERLGVKVRAIPRDMFNLEFDKQPATEEVKDLASHSGLRHGQASDGHREGQPPVDGLPGHGGLEARAHPALRCLDHASGPGDHGRL
jgi:hypothetical protein